MVILLIGLSIVLIILLILFIKYKIFTHYILDNFKHNNVIVYGKKRKGKDILFQWVINKRKDFYYSNISYGGKHKILTLKEVSCDPNDYRNFVNDNIVKTPHKFKEGKDIYISDGGNFLPSQMDSTLHKEFPSMPIYYSLSGHLYNSNVHVNSQNLERVWKALREQGDFFIKVIKTKWLFKKIAITYVITYEKYESAKANVLPMKVRILNKFSRTEKDKFDSQYGLIKYGKIISFKKNMKYDTRAFEKILLKGRRKK